jgi:hypothetical protein
MKKSQSMIVGFVAILVIMIVFVQLFISEYNNLNTSRVQLTDFEENARRIGEILSGPSAPYAWNSENVQKPGLSVDGIINSTLLNEYSNLEYYKSKSLLGSKQDYIFFFLNSTNVSNPITIGSNEYWGWPGTSSGNGGEDLDDVMGRISDNSKSIAKDERFVRLELVALSTPVIAKLVVYVW